MRASTRILIVFYSLEGSTKLVAHTLAEELGAELLEIKPEKEIRSTGFMRYFWGGRQVMMNIMPPLRPFSVNIEEFGTVIVGTPVWAFDLSPPIRAFLSRTAIEGKKVAVFCTHEGDPAKTLENMERALKNNVIISRKGFLNVAKNKEEAIGQGREWAEELKNAV